MRNVYAGVRAHKGNPNPGERLAKAFWTNSSVEWVGWSERARETILDRGNVCWMGRWVNLALKSELADIKGQSILPGSGK